MLGGGAVIVVVCNKCDCERKVNLRMLSLRYRSLQSSSCHEQKASMIMMTITQGVRALHVGRECKYISKESELKVYDWQEFRLFLQRPTGDRQLESAEGERLKFTLREFRRTSPLSASTSIRIDIIDD